MFGKLFGRASVDALLGEAAELEARGELGDAKLTFDRAAERAAREAPLRADEAHAGSRRCCDGIARRRIREAERLIREGALDLAGEELEHAAETAHSTELQAEAHALAASLSRTPDRDIVVATAADDGAQSDEEILATVMGGWTAAQTRELESYGEPLFEAVLAGARGQKDACLRGLRALAQRSRHAVYLRLELAEAALAAAQPAVAEEALRALLTQLGDAPDEHADACLAAHRQLAQLCHDRGDALGAERQLTAACEALLEDPRPYLDLGHYLRTLGRAQEAVEVLELCRGCFQDGAVEWPVHMELGLAQLQLGDRKAANQLLESAWSSLERLGVTELPPALQAALAAARQ